MHDDHDVSKFVWAVVFFWMTLLSVMVYHVWPSEDDLVSLKPSTQGQAGKGSVINQQSTKEQANETE
jgi:uncharacterized membrane protein YdfJ with MMPL/SSD domain